MKRLLVLSTLILFSLFLTFSAFAGSAKITATNSFYDAYDVSSATYVYNSDGDSGVTDGRYYVRNYEEKTVQIRIPTLGSTSIDLRVEGQVQGASTWADVYSKNYSSATTVDELVIITEQLDYIRIGLKVNTDGTDSVSVIGNFAVKRNIR